METPSTITSAACISNFCFACGVATIFPLATIAEPTFNLDMVSKFSSSSAYTICKGSKKVPSFTTIKPKVLESLILLIQPPTVTSLSIYASLSRYKSLISVKSMFTRLHHFLFHISPRLSPFPEYFRFPLKTPLPFSASDPPGRIPCQRSSQVLPRKNSHISS